MASSQKEKGQEQKTGKMREDFSKESKDQCMGYLLAQNDPDEPFYEKEDLDIKIS